MRFNVTVFGLGFVGLTTALGFAEKGNFVTGYDIDFRRSDEISSGTVPFQEPGLADVLNRHLGENFLLTTEPLYAVQQSDFIFLCVGTPCGENGKADLTYIFSALEMILPALNDDKYRVIIIKSPVPPSTTRDRILPWFSQRGYKPGPSFGVANNPEFLREGHCWDDFMNADRIVCGVENERSTEYLRSLYSTFEAPFFQVSLNTGEFIKYLSNTLLATMISYSNEMSMVADTIGNINIQKAFRILHMDKRWGGCGMSSYVYPGCGFGGYCLPKDTQAMIAQARESGFQPHILEDVVNTNNSMPAFMTNKIKQVATPSSSIGILELSFKPGSDDVRKSPSAKIIQLLLDEGFQTILAYDPVAIDEFKKKNRFSSVEYQGSLAEICIKADVLVIATAWPEFFELDQKYPEKKIVDCRYCLER